MGPPITPMFIKVQDGVKLTPLAQWNKSYSPRNRFNVLSILRRRLSRGLVAKYRKLAFRTWIAPVAAVLLNS
jgi:hypothetical protein